MTNRKIIDYLKQFPFHKQTFRTGEIFGAYLDLIWHLERIQNGSIVTFLITGTSAVGIRDAALLFQDLGSVLVNHLQPTSHWVWIFVKGGRTLFESSAIDSMNGVWFDSTVQLDSNNYEFKYGNDRRRAEFCDNHDGLGQLCNPTQSSSLYNPILDSLTNHSILDKVPVIVTGGYRLPYLSQCLEGLLKSPGVRKQNIEVFLGDTSKSVVEFLDIIDVKHSKIPVSGEGNSKLFQYYRSVYERVTKKYTTATAVIFLDEDVEVAPDFFSYMRQVIPLLHLDPTLYCVTAHNSGSGVHFYHDPNLVTRVASQVLWGYALTIDFIKEALRVWPTDPTVSTLYDTWLYYGVVGTRECLTAEVSRTRHFGAGLNTEGIDVEKVFSGNRLVKGTNIRISNLMDVTFRNWSRKTVKELQESKVIYGDPCQLSTFTGLSDGSYVFPYSLKVYEDETIYITNYFIIGECLQFYAKMDGGWHGMVTPIKINRGLTVYLIGVPASPYTKYIQYDTAWDHDSLNTTEKIAVRKQISSYDREKLADIENKYKKSNPVLELFHDDI